MPFCKLIHAADTIRALHEHDQPHGPVLPGQIAPFREMAGEFLLIADQSKIVRLRFRQLVINMDLVHVEAAGFFIVGVAQFVPLAFPRACGRGKQSREDNGHLPPLVIRPADQSVTVLFGSERAFLESPGIRGGTRVVASVVEDIPREVTMRIDDQGHNCKERGACCATLR